jgi:hypothetical protein
LTVDQPCDGRFEASAAIISRCGPSTRHRSWPRIELPMGRSQIYPVSRSERLLAGKARSEDQDQRGQQNQPKHEAALAALIKAGALKLRALDQISRT